MRVVPIDADTVGFYADIYARLRRQGRPIPTNDLWIAASAMQQGLRLLTLDRHFDLIDGLLTGAALETFCPETTRRTIIGGAPRWAAGSGPPAQAAARCVRQRRSPKAPAASRASVDGAGMGVGSGSGSEASSVWPTLMLPFGVSL